MFDPSSWGLPAPSTALVLASFGARRAAVDSVEPWSLRWDDPVAAVLEQAGVLSQLPDLQQLVDDPLVALRSGADGAALALRASMGWTRVTAGLSVFDRHSLMAWAAGVLAPHLRLTEPLPRLRHKVYPSRLTAPKGVITPEVLLQASGSRLTVELVTADGAVAQDTLEHLSTRFGMALPSLESVDRGGGATVAFGPATITIRRPSVADAATLMDVVLRPPRQTVAEYADRLRDVLGPATSATITLIASDQVDRRHDAVTQLCAALAGTGRLARVVTLATRPARPAHASAEQLRLDGDRKRVSSAVDDLLRDLGVRPIGVPAPVDLRAPALLAIWDCRSFLKSDPVGIRES